MKVKELIEALSKCNPDIDVYCLQDAHPSGKVTRLRGKHTVFNTNDGVIYIEDEFHTHQRIIDEIPPEQVGPNTARF